MFDFKIIRDDPHRFDAARAKRGLAPLAEEIVGLDNRRRAVQTRLQDLQRRRNDASRAIGQAKGRGEDADGLIAEVATLKDDTRAAEDDERGIAETLHALLDGEPNLPEDAVPAGLDEAEIEAFAISVPLRSPMKMAGIEVRSADNLIVRARDQDGTIGWGEAASAPTMTGELLDGMVAVVNPGRSETQSPSPDGSPCGYGL